MDEETGSTKFLIYFHDRFPNLNWVDLQKRLDPGVPRLLSLEVHLQYVIFGGNNVAFKRYVAHQTMNSLSTDYVEKFQG